MTPTRTLYRATLGRYLRDRRGALALLALLLFVGMGLQLLVPQIVRDFIDAAEAGSSLHVLTQAALLFLTVALCKYLVGIGASYLSQSVGWSATNALREDLAAHCLRLDMGFHHAHTPGALIERVDGDVGILSNFFSQFVLQVLGNLLLLVGVLVVIWLEEWRVGVAFTLFTLLALGLLASMREIATPAFKEVRQTSGDLLGFLEERLAGTEDIRANGGAAYTLNRLSLLMSRLWRADFTAYMQISRLRTTTSAMFALAAILALVLGSYLFRQGAISLGTVYLIFAYVQMLARPVERLTLEIQDLQNASASLVRVAELQQTPQRIADGVGRPLPAGALGVVFKDVTFGYEGRRTENPEPRSQNPEPRTQNSESRVAAVEPRTSRPEPRTSNAEFSVLGSRVSAVLNDLSFTLAPGRHLGLLGRTGSGKSTIARLLVRLYDPQAGSITLGGVDLRELLLGELRGRVGFVTQDVQLFSATVRDNLALFDATVPDERLLAVIDEVGLAPWLATLPDGLDTLLDGGRLSAGEGQLLALARVFLKDPGLVILDEASARLDPATEQRLDRAISRLLAGRTAIIIAHRLATVQHLDEVMILEGGRISEYGPRAALAADPTSRFAHLLHVGMEEALA